MLPVKNFKAVPGHGVEAVIDNRQVIIGNLKLMKDRGIVIGGLEERVGVLWEQGKTVMFVSVDSAIAGIIALSDTIKPGAIEAVRKLQGGA
jgi:Cu+-exporting ATPase